MKIKNKNKQKWALNMEPEKRSIQRIDGRKDEPEEKRKGRGKDIMKEGRKLERRAKAVRSA